MRIQAKPVEHRQEEKFALKLIEPFTTFQNSEPAAIPFVVDGLYTRGGFSALGSKPKQGKSSFSRFEAVQIAKGRPILGRNTKKGGVIMVSLEDPLNHIDNCLRALGYDPRNDALIQTVQDLPVGIENVCEVLADELSHRQDVCFVTIDTLAKVLSVNDLNDYMQVMTAAKQLRELAREFSDLHIQVIAHNKKAETSDPFDAILGSTALRGEPDTNVVIFKEKGQHILQAETRVGRHIQASLLKANVIEIAGAEVVQNYWLDGTLQGWKANCGVKEQGKVIQALEQRIVAFLEQQSDGSACREAILEMVTGSSQKKLQALQSLTDHGVLDRTGSGQKGDPYVYRLMESKTPMNEFLTQFDGNGVRQ